MDVFRLLDQSAVVRDFDVVDRRTWKTGSYLRLKVLLCDGSVLHVRDYISETERKYSFHWQGRDGALMVRWDNAPHYPGLSTHPDHKHASGQIQASIQLTLEEILVEIESRLS